MVAAIYVVFLLNLVIASSLLGCVSLPAAMSKSRNSVPRNKLTAKQSQGSSANKKEEPSKAKTLIDSNLLPPLTNVMEDIKMTHHLPKFLKMGVVDTRTLIRLVDMDFRILQMDYDDVTSAEIAQVRAKTKELIVAATVLEKPKRMDLDERKDLKYGRVYLESGVQSFEYLLATFGAPPALGSYPFIVAKSPEDGCSVDETTDLTGHVFVVRRGGCSYLAKAKVAEAANAAALIVTNLEDSLERPSSGYGIDPAVSNKEVQALSHLPIIQTANTSWMKFVHSEVYNGTIDIVPLRCGSNGSCLAVTPEERSLLPEVTYGDIVVESAIDGSGTSTISRRFEFLTSNYGGALPFDDAPLLVMIADPLDACSPLKTAIEPGKVTAIVAARGGCRFDVKSLAAQEAGARLLIVVDPNDGPLLRLGGQNPNAGYIGIPSIIAPTTFMELVKFQPLMSIRIDAGADGHEQRVLQWTEAAQASWSDHPQTLLEQLEGAAAQAAARGHTELERWLERRSKRARAALTVGQEL